MWETYQQAEKWSKLPSEILFIDDWFDARSVNQAVWHFGTSLEAAMNKAGDREKNDKARKAKREAVLMKWLSTGAAIKQHRDPATAQSTVKRA